MHDRDQIRPIALIPFAGNTQGCRDLGQVKSAYWPTLDFGLNQQSPRSILVFRPGRRWRAPYHVNFLYWPSDRQPFFRIFQKCIPNYPECLQLLDGETDEQRSLRLIAVYRNVLSRAAVSESMFRNNRRGDGASMLEVERSTGELNY